MPLIAKLMLTQNKSSARDNSAELVMESYDQVSTRNEIQTAKIPGESARQLSVACARIDFGVENLDKRVADLPLAGAGGSGSTMALNAANMPWGIAVPGAGRSRMQASQFEILGSLCTQHLTERLRYGSS
ncbi:MAG: hypothetical protein IPP84_14705 [Propionivibrio sp.]|uniref:hypothetical protein n=1 Tax=Propionivibrio sp. TaxID=2212460 RepID=UPI0025D3D5A5|nr:hypothetical protein [Propionivibrio sp.]MBL0209135.1 hypothetical protein [Propionivibrio sp.]